MAEREATKLPAKSQAQLRWINSPSGHNKALGDAGVKEWDQATKGKKLPEKVGGKSSSWMKHGQ